MGSKVVTAVTAKALTPIHCVGASTRVLKTQFISGGLLHFRVTLQFKTEWKENERNLNSNYKLALLKPPERLTYPSIPTLDFPSTFCFLI